MKSGGVSQAIPNRPVHTGRSSFYEDPMRGGALFYRGLSKKMD
jgi:hypothetical protein